MYVYLFKIVDCYMNTIVDIGNENDFLNHYNEFEYNHDLVLVVIIVIVVIIRVNLT